MAAHARLDRFNYPINPNKIIINIRGKKCQLLHISFGMQEKTKPDQKVGKKKAIHPTDLYSKLVWETGEISNNIDAAIVCSYLRAIARAFRLVRYYFCVLSIIRYDGT